MKSLDQIDADIAQVNTLATDIDAKAEKRAAINATNTPGDDNDAFIISQPGSYCLTGNVATGLPNGIEVTAGGVTVDLNGFAVLHSGTTAEYHSPWQVRHVRSPFVIVIFFHSNRVYVAWAEIASLLALVAGFGFVGLRFHIFWIGGNSHLDRDSYPLRINVDSR